MSMPNLSAEKKRAEAARHIALLHAQNETFLLHADALDRYCEACTASGNMAAGGRLIKPVAKHTGFHFAQKSLKEAQSTFWSRKNAPDITPQIRPPFPCCCL